jgi:hypothetical protein
MEKTGEIKKGITPPEHDTQKISSAQSCAKPVDLAEHVTKRVSELAAKSLK